MNKNNEFSAKQKSHLKMTFYFGWGGRIRTAEMPESKSGALPLGYTPMLP